MKRLILFAFLIGISMFAFMFIVTTSWIQFEVDNRCEIAQEKYPGDCVEALISYLNDESNPYKSRNSAIWALGQIGDERAFATLNSYYTGIIPDREPLDGGISQYELKKAVNLTSGGLNLSKLVR